MAIAHIALGSNIDPEDNFVGALNALNGTMRVRSIGRVYRTPPWGYTEQKDFLNTVVAIEQVPEPAVLLEALLAIENRLGRVRTVTNGPRTIDLDLLFYEQLIINSDRLTVPHPRLHERAFVLVPLCDLVPEFRHPVLGESMLELLVKVDQQGVALSEFQLDRSS